MHAKQVFVIQQLRELENLGVWLYRESNDAFLGYILSIENLLDDIIRFSVYLARDSKLEHRQYDVYFSDIKEITGKKVVVSRVHNPVTTKSIELNYLQQIGVDHRSERIL